MTIILKWLLILWTLACLAGIVAGIAKIDFKPQPTDAELIGMALGAGAGLALWLIFWAAISAPLYLLYKLLNRRPAPPRS